jgi:hypothetical protein
MRYWENIVNGSPPDKWWETVKNTLNQCIIFLDKLDYDFILLQETFPFCLKNYITYYHELSYELSSELVKKEITANNSGWWGSSICINRRNKFVNNCFYNGQYEFVNGFYQAGSKIYNGLLYFGDDYNNQHFWGFPAFMSFNCECEGRIITIINIYGKFCNKKNNYFVLDNMYNHIKCIVENYGNEHLIVLAGDFNATTQPTSYYPHGNQHNINLFEKIKNDLGFIDCRNDSFTNEDGYTIHYIFIKGDYQCIEPSKMPMKVIGENGKKLTNHFLIDCEIKM